MFISRQLAQAESRRQTQTLNEQAVVLHEQAAALRHEIESHQRTDAQLQECHRLHPFITIWDDHEISNNVNAENTGEQWKKMVQNAKVKDRRYCGNR